MAEYVKKSKLIERLNQVEENYKADHEYDIEHYPFSDGVFSAMFSAKKIVNTEPVADVVERSKINKVIEEIESHKYDKGSGFDEFSNGYIIGLLTAAEIVSKLISTQGESED